jgi:hypothetical protein
MGFLDTFFGLAGAATGDQKGMASADTITVDTGPVNVGGGAMSLVGGSTWLLPVGLFLLVLLLRRS